MDDATVRAGVLPFEIAESFGVGCGYERSFKLSRRRVLANRYLLGVQTADVGTAKLIDACRRLDMPADLLAQFEAGLAGANLVFLGFEDTESNGCIHKVYLEYWDLLRSRLRSGKAGEGPHLLHKGFKWYVDASERKVVTLYHCVPGLGIKEIQRRIDAMYENVPVAATRDAVRNIIDLAAQRQPGKRFLFVEVGESGNPRQSFDLNLYPAGLRLREVAGPIRLAARSLEVPPDKLERLIPMIADKPFGHVSGGLSRDGEEYLTIYYER